jgi:UDP:flavonoid glycosyltransferase YjiC (YdhE family)
MPTALFFPSYLGSGFGHVSRCLALAEELKMRGWHAHFALAGIHADKVRQAEFSVFEPRRPFRPRARETSAPAFTVFADMNYQIARDRFRTPRIVRATLREAQGLLKRVRPDVLIGDTWPLTSIIGQRAGLPVIQIIKSVVHPACPRLIWWENAPADLVSPNIQPIFNPVLAKLGMPPIKRAEDLLVGDLLLVPSIPELDPLPQGLANTHYVGPLTQRGPRMVEHPDWFDQLDSDRPLVYVTIGGGADPVSGIHLFKVLFEALGDLALQVVVSTSIRPKPGDLPMPPANFVLEEWVPGLAMIARSDIVIFHGGYGTTMETIHCGVPSIIIPFHSEQEANGRRLESSGAGLVILHGKDPYQSVQLRWPGGDFTLLVAPRPTVKSLTLRQTVERLLSDELFRRNAMRLKNELAIYGGPSLAADLVEHCVNG